jgi:hypothetical protein
MESGPGKLHYPDKTREYVSRPLLIQPASEFALFLIKRAATVPICGAEKTTALGVNRPKSIFAAFVN